MRKLAKAPQSDFSTYIARPDTEWIERETTDDSSMLYGQGFLPYSGAAHVHDIFYSARSARVVLGNFSMTSENRRIAKRFEGRFTHARIPVAEFVPSEQFWDLSLRYFKEKHGADTMPRERLETILSNPTLTHVHIYSEHGIPVAYVLEAMHGTIAHYWFSFYELAYARQSLGLWLMLDCIQQAKHGALTHYYLGTVYGPHALYKTNFSPLQWWDGSTWSTDTRKLKELSRSEQ